jgi:UDP-glucose 4-epimerase
MGSSGFIGRHFCQILEKNHIEFIGLGSKEINLKNSESISLLDKLVEDGDSIVNFASISPTKDSDTLDENLHMVLNFSKGCEKKFLKKLVIVSSDAVYGDRSGVYNENSILAPDNLHGIMHLNREAILSKIKSEIISIVRPTNVYGFGDPHNSYGPNRFIKNAKSSGVIEMFGEGESKRDHIYVKDVAQLIYNVYSTDYSVKINGITGQSITFKEIANLIKSKMDQGITIKSVGSEPLKTFKRYETKNIYQMLEGQAPITIDEGLDIYLKDLNFFEK